MDAGSHFCIIVSHVGAIEKNTFGHNLGDPIQLHVPDTRGAEMS